MNIYLPLRNKNGQQYYNIVIVTTPKKSSLKQLRYKQSRYKQVRYKQVRYTFFSFFGINT
jgi:hypothetical protein